MTFFTRIKIVGRENIIPRLDEDFRHFCRKSPRAYVDTARRRYFDKTVKEAQPGTIALFYFALNFSSIRYVSNIITNTLILWFYIITTSNGAIV